MKIAVVFVGFTGPYGAERLVLNMCSELIKLGNEVTLFTPKYDRRCNNMLHPDLKVIESGHFKVYDWEFSKFLEHYSVAKIYKKLNNEFDIINVHNYPTPLDIALAKKFKRLKVPAVYQCNEPPRFIYDLSKETYERLNIIKRIGMKTSIHFFKEIDQWSVSHVDQIIAISKFIQEQIKKIYGRDSRFIMPGIETKKFNPNIDGSGIREMYAKDDEFVILTCNKLHPRKRIDLLIKAIAHVVERYNKIKVIITGDGIEQGRLDNLIKKLNLSSYIKLVGFISDEDLPKYYAACDVFVFTAIREPQIGSPAEALASGKPVIAPDDGSPAETIIDGKTGLLFKPLDPEDLAKKIIWAIEHKDILPQMGKNGRKWVEENMTWKAMTLKTFEVFREVL